jgi:hypothetical protein
MKPIERTLRRWRGRQTPYLQVLFCLTSLLGACEWGEAQTGERARQIAEEVVPEIEQAVGLSYKSPPRIQVRSRNQMRSYIDAKIRAELPQQEVERLSLAYRLFGLIPDTLDLRALLAELYYEQVVGYFDPDSSTLYLPEGMDPALLRFTVAHELVHALQDQYVPLSELLSADQDNDRRAAAQAMLEGQATLISLLDMLPERTLGDLGEVWPQARTMIRDQQSQMPVLAATPLVIREGLIFPYLTGADFMQWFMLNYPDTVPYGPRLPQSTEQILHPDKYRQGDPPVDLAFDDTTGVVYENGLGELETRILLTELTGSEATASAGALGWAGDRYAVLQSNGDHALVWWSVWDDVSAANKFVSLLELEWPGHVADGWRYVLERTEVEGRAAALLVYAPELWGGWDHPPRVSVRSPVGS